MRQIVFFATKDDLLPMLCVVEAHASLNYALAGNFQKPGLEEYSNGAEIPNLGRATCESAVSSDTYLVYPRSLPIEVRVLEGDGGAKRYCVDQLLNPDTVGFTPAGVWNDEVMLYGRVATASDSAGSQALMRRFHTAIKKRFARVKGYYVGTQAYALLKAGKRLTIAEQSPREFDLVPEDHSR
jgi:hypothetical protein